MKSICVTPDRALQGRDIPAPAAAAPGHLLIDMDASAINPGDKAFLRMPASAGPALAASRHDVWGASGAGRVLAIGEGVPARYAGRQVAVYRSLGRSPETLGLWCPRTHVPYTSCVILPEHVRARDYCGSLVNVITAHAFLEEIANAGHKAVIVTAGNSATGDALAALARRRDVPAIFLVRSDAARAALQAKGAEHVIVTGEGFGDALGAKAAALGATAVFDGVGGPLLGTIAACLPMDSTIYCYGFLAGAGAFSMPSALLMMKNLTLRRFSNFESPTVRDRVRLAAALEALEDVIDDPLFATRCGREFSYEEIGQAIDYAPPGGARAALVP